MRKALLLAALLAPVSEARAEPLFGGAAPAPLLGQEMTHTLGEAVRPAYRMVETLSDGAFSFMRVHLLGRILPGRLNRELEAPPRTDSYAAFERHFARREARFLERLRESYPNWREDAGERQAAVAVDALADALLERYRLPRFGRASGEYAKRRRNWDPGFVAAAGIIGGGIAYLNGIHGDVTLGPLRFDLDLKSGIALERALRAGSRLERAAELELGYRRSPVTLAAAWTADSGALRSDSLGLKYRLRY